jgi:hypothetical protein
MANINVEVIHMSEFLINLALPGEAIGIFLALSFWLKARKNAESVTRRTLLLSLVGLRSKIAN